VRMEERSLIWRVAANILNKKSRTADKLWSSSLGVGRGANICSLQKVMMLRNSRSVSLGLGLVIWCKFNNEIDMVVPWNVADCMGQFSLQKQPGK
jgi:hypothetical protein